MKILLVNPPVNRLCDISINYFPLGLGYLAALANRQGYKALIYNAEFDSRAMPLLTNRRRITNHRLFKEAIRNDDHVVWDEFRSVLRDTDPDIVGFSCTSASLMACLKMAEAVKRYTSGIVVFGGIHPTILPEETSRLAHVDYIIAGDGEESFLAFIKATVSGKSPLGIPGVGSFQNKKFYFTTPKPLEKDIDAFPQPDRDSLINFDEQKNHLQAMITSRGCPYQCTFCSGRNITKGIVRYRAVKQVVAEMRLLKERYGVSEIRFYDDALVVNKERLRLLCQEICKQNLKVSWGGFTRADSFDKELLCTMRKSGCRFLGVGVESGSTNVLSKIKKGYTREDALSSIKLIKASGIDVGINIMVGFPFETAEDIQDSISLIKILDVSANINTFTPYPKTEIYDLCVDLGLIERDIDWLLISQHSPYNEFVRSITMQEYRKLLDEIISVADSILKRKYQEYCVRNFGKILTSQWKHPIRGAKIVSRKAVSYLKKTFSR